MGLDLRTTDTPRLSGLVSLEQRRSSSGLRLERTGKAALLSALATAVAKDPSLPQDGSLQAMAAAGAAGFDPTAALYVSVSAGIVEVGPLP